MVVLAQGFTALQFVMEEKFLGTYRMQPLLAVGIEGAWGVVLSLAAVPLLSLVHTGDDGQPLDDAGAAFRAMWEVPSLRNAVMLSVLSIGAFNFFGLSVTAALSGASRATIDACRTVFIWAFSLMAGWESFKQLQVVGFLVLLSGTSLYNELLRSCLPHLSASARAALLQADGGSSSGSCSDDDEGGGEDEEQGVLVQGSGDKANGWHTSTSRSQLLDASQGNNLNEPLLGPSDQAPQQAPGLSRPPSFFSPRQAPNTRSPSHSQRITGQGGAHHPSGVYTMARSMRLGYNALSPHDLVDDDEGSVMAVESVDVMDPMMLASTPYCGRAGGLRSMISDAVSSTQTSPRQSMSELDDSQHFTSAGGGGGGGGGGGAGMQQNSSGAQAMRGGGGAAAVTPGGGFMAFMAARQQEKEEG